MTYSSYKFVQRVFCMLTLTCAATLPQQILAAPVPTDSNGDGISELVVVRQQGQSLEWVTYDVSDMGNPQRNTFGVSSDVPVPGAWRSSGVMSTMLVRNEDGTLNWLRQEDSGLISNFELGLAKLYYIAGPDFNGNGISDICMVRVKKKGTLEWTCTLDPFAGSSQTLKPFNFGKAGGRVFTYSLDGVVDRPAWIGRLKKKKVSMKVRLGVGRKAKSIKIKGIPPTAFPKNEEKQKRPRSVRSGQGADYVVLTNETVGETRFRIFAIDTSVKRPKADIFFDSRILGRGIVTTGNILPDVVGDELLLTNGSSVQVVNPREQRVSNLQVQAGMMVDYFNVQRLTE